MTAQEKLFHKIFDIVDKYDLPFTNSPAKYKDKFDIGDLCGDIEKAVLEAGYISPAISVKKLEMPSPCGCPHCGAFTMQPHDNRCPILTGVFSQELYDERISQCKP